jgi:hypothetical protein
MRVQPETIPWAAAFLSSRPNTVACARCYHSPVETFEGKPYSGARLDTFGIGKDASEPQAFVAKWRKSETTGPIGAVMGAFYSFRRDWYMDGLRRPWQYGTGWGSDEELISAATWLRGGSVHLLPVAVWHRARGPADVPYKLTNEQVWGVWGNRLRMLYMMPMPQEELIAMYRHLANALTVQHWRKVELIAKCGEVSWYREFLAAGPMKWAEFKAQIMDRENVEVAKEVHKAEKPKRTPRKSKAQRVLLPSAIAVKARILDMEEEKAVTTPPAHVANWGAAETPRACPMCKKARARCYKTHRAAGFIRRYRNCNECGRNFMTREAIAD